MEIHDHLRLEAKRNIKELEEGNKKYFSTQWGGCMINGEYLKKTKQKRYICSGSERVNSIFLNI